MTISIFAVIVCVACGYLLGSVNTSIIVSKFYKTDIRTLGSGNAGTTNTLRSLGKGAALVVLLGDAAKAAVAILVARGIMVLVMLNFPLSGAALGVLEAAQYAAALACVVGHNYPAFFGFKGGKGVLTSVVAVLFFDWRCGLIGLLVFIVLLAIFRYVSLGSIVAAVATPAASILLHNGLYTNILFVLLGILLIVRHTANIKRLVNGTENKISAKKKGAQG